MQFYVNFIRIALFSAQFFVNCPYKRSILHNLEKPSELATRVGVSVSAIRHLIRTRQLDHVFVTPRRRSPLIPAGAWERYVDGTTVRAICSNAGQSGEG